MAALGACASGNVKDPLLIAMVNFSFKAKEGIHWAEG
jgi:hypothetical protein